MHAIYFICKLLAHTHTHCIGRLGPALLITLYPITLNKVPLVRSHLPLLCAKRTHLYLVVGSQQGFRVQRSTIIYGIQ